MRIPASWARRGLVIFSVLAALNLLVIPIAWSGPGAVSTPAAITPQAASTLPVVTVDATDASAGEGAVVNPGEFTLTRTGSTDRRLVVSFTLGGTASSGDYSEWGTSSVTFPATSDTVKVPVTPLNDSVAERTETVLLEIVDKPQYDLGSPSTATVNIADDDAVVVTVEATDASAGEGAVVNPGEFTLTRTGSTDRRLVVSFTLGGTASSGDYSEWGTSSVTFPATSDTVKVTVTPLNDSVAERTETVVLTLSAGTGYAVGTPSTATVNIADGDGYVPEKREDQKDLCKKGGWVDFGVFKNQGDCVSYFATGGKNPPALGPAPTDLSKLLPLGYEAGHPGKGKAKGKKK